MRFTEIENNNITDDQIETILDIARKHQGYVTMSQLEGIYPLVSDEKNAKRIFNLLNRKYRVNVINDLDDVKNTGAKYRNLDAESKKLFDFFTSPERNNINNDVVKSLLANALYTKKINGSNWMTLTNNIRSADGDTTRAAEWNIARKMGKLGVSIDQSLTIGQKRTAIQPSSTEVNVPKNLSGADAKAYEKIVSKTNSKKRKMISDILIKAFEEKNKKIAAGETSRYGEYVKLPKDISNKLLVNVAMRQADIGRLLGPLGIALTF